MKKNTIIGWAMTALVALTGCLDEHVKPTDMTLKVGNVYCADGTIVPVDYYTQGYDSYAVGVVMAVGSEEDNFRAIILALEDLGQSYFLNELNLEVDNVSTNTEECNGKEGTSALVYAASQDKAINPQAAILCGNYMAGGVTGWHLPSIAELRRLVQHQSTVSRSLKMLYAHPLREDWYQTSTADGTSEETTMMYNYVITLPEGRVTSSLMTEEHYVRPVLTLQ